MKILARRWIRYTSGISAILMLAGCVAPPPPPRLTPYPPFTCDSFTEPHWQEFSFGADSNDDANDIVAKVVQLWALDRDQVQIEPMSEKSVVILWQVVFSDGSDLRYTARFHQDLNLTSVRFAWWDRKPTIAQVIDCLGLPEHYSAYYYQDIGARVLEFELWYTKKGFVVRSYTLHRQDQPPEIRPAFPMTSFTSTVPGDLERMISTLHIPVAHAFVLCSLRPWPGSIGAIEVESFLGEDARCKPP